MCRWVRLEELSSHKWVEEEAVFTSALAIPFRDLYSDHTLPSLLKSRCEVKYWVRNTTDTATQEPTTTQNLSCITTVSGSVISSINRGLTVYLAPYFSALHTLSHSNPPTTPHKSHFCCSISSADAQEVK